MKLKNLIVYVLLAFVTTVNAQRVVSHPQGVKIGTELSQSPNDVVLGIGENGIVNHAPIKLDSIAQLKNIPTALSDLSDDIGAVEGVLPLSAFLDVDNGNDATAQLEQSIRPFKTMAALIAALPPTEGETYTIYLIGDVIDMPVMPQRSLRFVSYTGSTLDYSNIVGGLTFDIYGTDLYNWTFENSNISIICNKVEQTIFSTSGIRSNINLFGIINVLDWKTEIGFSTFGAKFMLGAESNLTIKTVVNDTPNVDNGSYFHVDGDYTSNLKIKNLLLGDINHNLFNRYTGNVEIENLKEVTNSAKEQLTIGGGVAYVKLTIGNVDYNGIVRFYDLPYLKFNGTFTDQSLLYLQGVEYITGSLVNNTWGTRNSIANAEGTTFENFSGKIQAFQTAAPITFKGINFIDTGSLRTYMFYANNSKVDFDYLTFEGYTTLVKSSETELISSVGSEGVNVVVKGTVKKNRIAWGENVNVLYETFTGKEKSKEIVINSKEDIINKVLDPTFTYVFDCVCDNFVDGEQIIIPYDPTQPNITLNGYGLEASVLKKTSLTNEPLFISPTGGSGGLQMDAIKLICEDCPIFNLEDATGYNAVEFVKVNFEDSESIGTLDGFRQVLWTNIGLFNLNDGLELKGTMLGGFRSETVIARNLSGSTGTLFKKGASLTFGSRFFTNANVDLPIGWKFADFETTNFLKEKTFQIESAIITREGEVDISDALYFPNIDEESISSNWANNTGINNSSVKFQKIKSNNGTVYIITVSDAGVLQITAQ